MCISGDRRKDEHFNKFNGGIAIGFFLITFITIYVLYTVTIFYYTDIIHELSQNVPIPILCSLIKNKDQCNIICDKYCFYCEYDSKCHYSNYTQCYTEHIPMEAPLDFKCKDVMGINWSVIIYINVFLFLSICCGSCYYITKQKIKKGYGIESNIPANNMMVIDNYY